MNLMKFTEFAEKSPRSLTTMPKNLGAHYQALDEEFRKAGYKFADLPPKIRNP